MRQLAFATKCGFGWSTAGLIIRVGNTLDRTATTTSAPVIAAAVLPVETTFAVARIALSMYKSSFRLR